MPGRWTQYDEPEYRTGGLQRVGYDADSERYYFQDGEDLYEGEPGAEMGGQMRYIGKAPPPPPPHVVRENDRLAWRQLAPFFLILGIFMLLGYKYITSASSHLPPVQQPAACPDGLDRYVVRKGDTCWEIARTHQWTIGELVAANKEVDCDNLQIGRELCVRPQYSD